MPTWIEIRCDKRGDGVETKARCWSDDNAGPSEMAADDQASILATLRELHEQANVAGWKRTRDGWVCPTCSGH